MPMPAYSDGGLLIEAPSTAKSFATRLRQSLREFEGQLKDNEDVRIVAMLGGRPYAVEHIAVRGSELVVIDGPADDEKRHRLLCHVSALQLMLHVEPKHPDEKRRRIGFFWDEHDANGTAQATPAPTPDGPPPADGPPPTDGPPPPDPAAGPPKPAPSVS